MNQEIKELWVENLTSGKYTQGHYFLRDKDSNFCCLGVLCDLYVKAGNAQWLLSENATKHKTYKIGFEKEGGQLPKEVMRWAGFTPGISATITIESRVSENTTTLSSLNDTGTTFKEIAKIIEERL